MTPDQIERYARHIVLREVGGQGQQKLLNAKLLCIGAGGLGSAALMYLAAAGVGTLGIVDNDTVSLSNLQRQIAHDMRTIDLPKTQSAAASINRLNPDIVVIQHNERLTEENGDTLFGSYDLVLDGTDNFDSRYSINQLCVAHRIPLISAAMSQWEGQVSVYDPAKEGPCYACVFPERPAAGLAPSCAEAGIMGALAGVMGSMMAVEAIKVITEAGQPLRGEIVIYDALYGETRKLKTKRDAFCRVCRSG